MKYRLVVVAVAVLVVVTLGAAKCGTTRHGGPARPPQSATSR